MKLLEKTRLATAVAVSLSTLVMAGCGGSSSDNDETSNIVSRGKITGFGSVYVNGRRFATDSASIFVDDSRSVESELRMGMVVTVRGSSDDGEHWQASEIDYDNELKGPVSSIVVDPMDATRKTLVVLGQTVIVDSNTTFDDDGGLGFDSLLIGDVLEISGFVADGSLLATHIELQDNDDEIEIKGYIENLGVDSFEINGFAVSFDASTELDDIDVLEEGLFVEAEGQLDAAGTTLIADKIEGEDDDIDDDDNDDDDDYDFELEGMISDFDAVAMTFRIHGQLVDISSADLFPSSLVLADGLVVEVEGHLVDGVLVAQKIKQRGKKIKISAPLSAVAADSVSFSFNGSDVVIRVHSGTELEDDISNMDISLADLSVGDFVELKAFEDGSGVINAREIERSSPDEIEIEAPVDAFNAALQSVELFGIEFDLSAASFEDDDDNNISAMTFFGSLSIGEFIEIEDSDSNGIFDKAELDD